MLKCDIIMTNQTDVTGGCSSMRELPKAKEIWHHFKNKNYEIITIAEHTETGEKFVIYKALEDT
ncbi:DUF1653 domain-containing protein, partial [uncultured Megasphaera sp.]|uniref:DUF1653 domain-containing protein n=1 Tax=uncultured Megasphaera sp. TaxID=165188 RepID=UPI0034653D31